MKSTKLLNFASILWMLCVGGITAANGNRLIVVLPSNIDEDMAQYYFNVINSAMESAPVGANILFLQGAADPQVWLNFTKKEYANNNVKNREFIVPRNYLCLKLLESAQGYDNTTVTAGIDIPAVLRLLENHIQNPTRIILIGSTLGAQVGNFSFLDPTVEDNELKYRIPSAGHLRGDSLFTPYSTMDFGQSFQGCEVVWLDLTRFYNGGVSGYYKYVSSFWSAYFDHLGITLRPIQTTLQLANHLSGEFLGKVNPQYDLGMNEIKMFTIADLKTQLKNVKKEPVEVVQKPIQANPVPTKVNSKRIPTSKFTMFLTDRSGSMGNNIAEVGRRLAAQDESPENEYGLISFSDPENFGGRTTHVFSSPEALKISFDTLPPAMGGADSLDAFSTALLTAHDYLKANKIKGARILIYADVAPLESQGRPKGKTYVEVIAKIIAEGHKISYVKCNPLLDMGWLPKSVEVLPF